MKFNRTKVEKFQDQICMLTLSQALDAFYSVNSNIFSVPKPNTEWTELLVRHDVAHVFFGVNTNILDESEGDYWTIFGTDLSMKQHLLYAKYPEGKKLIKNIGFINIVKSLFLGIPLLYKVYFHSRKMTRKWSIRGYHQYMNRSLVEIRKEFNLHIFKYDA
jgi:hypothetical protein